MNPKLLIVAATSAELAKTFAHFSLPAEDFVQTSTFDVLITGVGMTATAFALGKHLPSNYHLVLNVGIAGSFDPQLPLGSLVNVYSDTFAELGAEDHDRFITIDELGFGQNTFKASFDGTNFPKVRGITVNKVHGQSTSIAITRQRFDPQTESMEGAAVFYACHMLQLNCLQIRSISNYVTPRAKENWQIGLAIKNLNDWLINFIDPNTRNELLMTM